MKPLFALAGLALMVSGCVATPDDGEGDAETETDGTLESGVATTPGVNGGACYMSAYNCKLRVEGGNRIAHKDGTLDCGVNVNAGVLDGNGDLLGLQKGDSLKFNYGQKRTFGGKTYVYAITTSNHSSGRFPLSAVKSADDLWPRLGDVRAHRSGLDKMACYKVKDSSDAGLEIKKIVYDTAEDPGPSGEAAGDYLPRLRTNGKRSINLIYNVPGSGLGGPAIDHFPAGTKFQRLAVPTDTGHPSLDVKLWAQSDNGHFTKAAGVMKFIYGSIATKTGETRVGWMAYDAVTPSGGGP